MFFPKRRFQVNVAPLTPDEVAARLKECDSFVACLAFLLPGREDGTAYVLANDSTSEDGAQEFAVLRVRPSGDAVAPVSEVLTQIDSITVSWMDIYRLRRYLNDLAAGHFDGDAHDYPVPAPTNFEGAPVHDRCPLCA